MPGSTFYPMRTRKLPNYLRTHRKRSGFSQGELAFLLGCQSEAKVSRYERSARMPNLETAFACESVFGVPARELFPGFYQKVEKTVHQRARALEAKIKSKHPDRMICRKLGILRPMMSLAKSGLNTNGLPF